MVEMYLNNTLNSFVDFSASDWYNKIPISLFQKPKNIICMNLGFWDVSRPPPTKNKTALHILGDTRTLKENQEQTLDQFSKKYFYRCRHVGNPDVWYCSKRWAPENDEGPSNKISKILDMYFIAIKNMKWKSGNMYQISFENIKHFMKPSNQKPKTKKP